MSQESTHASQVVPKTRKSPPPPVSIQVWPAVQEPKYLFLLFAACALLFVLSIYETRDLLAASLVSAVVLFAGWRILVPTTMEINSHGITLHAWRKSRIPWRTIQRAHVEEEGIWIFPDRSLLPGLGKTYVPLLEQSEEILTLIDFYRPQSLHYVPGGKRPSSIAG